MFFYKFIWEFLDTCVRVCVCWERIFLVKFEMKSRVVDQQLSLYMFTEQFVSGLYLFSPLLLSMIPFNESFGVLPWKLTWRLLVSFLAFRDVIWEMFYGCVDKYVVADFCNWSDCWIIIKIEINRLMIILLNMIFYFFYKKKSRFISSQFHLDYFSLPLAILVKFTWILHTSSRRAKNIAENKTIQIYDSN